jgi:hypothetical protein
MLSATVRAGFHGTVLTVRLLPDTFANGQTSSRMGAHETVDIVITGPEPVQESYCKSTLAIVAMDDQLGDPTYTFTIIHPTAGKRISGETVIDNHSDVRAFGILGKVLSSKAVRINLHAFPCRYQRTTLVHFEPTYLPWRKHLQHLQRSSPKPRSVR